MVLLVLFGSALADLGDSLDTGGTDVFEDPSANTLLLMPTAEVNAKGNLFFDSRQLLFIDLGGSITPSTQLTGGFIFPVQLETNALSLEIKQRLFSFPEYYSSFSVFGSGFLPLGNLDSFAIGDNTTWTVGSVLSIGNRSYGAHIMASGDFYLDESIFYIAVGADVMIDKHLKLILEYWNRKTDNIELPEANAMVCMGFRVFGRNFSFDLAGVRSVEGMGNTIFIPYAQFKYHIR